MSWIVMEFDSFLHMVYGIEEKGEKEINLLSQQVGHNYKF